MAAHQLSLDDALITSICHHGGLQDHYMLPFGRLTNGRWQFVVHDMRVNHGYNCDPQIFKARWGGPIRQRLTEARNALNNNVPGPNIRVQVANLANIPGGVDGINNGNAHPPEISYYAIHPIPPAPAPGDAPIPHLPPPPLGPPNPLRHALQFPPALINRPQAAFVPGMPMMPIGLAYSLPPGPQSRYYPVSLEVPPGCAPEGVFSFRRRLICQIVNAGTGHPTSLELRCTNVHDMTQADFDAHMLSWFRDMTRAQRNITRAALQNVRVFLASQVRDHPNDLHAVMEDEATLLQAEFALRNTARESGDPEVNNMPDPGAVGYRGVFENVHHPAYHIPPGLPPGAGRP